jgi:uncharacterized protein (TIGR03435 family)
MPCEFKIGPDHRLVSGRIWGVLTYADLKGARSRMATHPAFRSSFDQLIRSDEMEQTFGTSSKPAPGQPVSLSARKYSMPMLANLLTQIGPGPTVDNTDLKGSYDFKLSWDETAGPSLFTALQGQIGLKLEPCKVPVFYFVIDSAQRPGGN